MSRSRRENFSLPPVKKIYSYCDKHRKLYDDDLWSEYENYLRELSYQDDKEVRRNVRTSRAESLVKSSSGRQSLFKSSANERETEERPTPSKLDSPTSCLKSAGSRKKSGIEKRVNFNEQSLVAELSTEDYYQESSEDYYEEGDEEEEVYGHQRLAYARSRREDYDESTSSYRELPRGQDYKRERAGTAIVRPAVDVEPPTRRSSPAHKDPTSYTTSYDLDRELTELKRSVRRLEKSDAGSYNGQGESVRRSRNPRDYSRVRNDLVVDETPESSHRSRYDTGTRRTRAPREEHSPSRGYGTESFDRRSKCRRNRAGGAAAASGRQPRSACASESSATEPAVTEEEKRMIDQLNRMSLNSSTCCFERRREEEPKEKPRVVRARDASRRAAVKRMLVYPSEGQSGSPITLYKQWSNVTCHVEGDSRQGYRYKVYYLQKFESDEWQPDDKTGCPFRRVEDADCSTDYG